MFTELAHFPTRRERLRALNLAFSTIPGLLALVLLILAAASVMTYTLDVLALGPLLSFSWLLEWSALAVTLMLTTVLTTFALVSGHVQRQLRLQLSASGLDLCIRCGYQLRGVASTACPECGGNRSRVALQYPAAIRILLGAGLLLAVLQLSVMVPLALQAGRFEWSHLPGLLCWVFMGVYCWKHTTRSFRFRS